VVAAGGGALGYALAISATQQAFSQAVVSLGCAAIMYGAVRYLASRASG
jgi:eukaryotic-like serine/threonine-protein kinase